MKATVRVAMDISINGLTHVIYTTLNDVDLDTARFLEVIRNACDDMLKDKQSSTFQVLLTHIPQWANIDVRIMYIGQTNEKQTTGI